MDLHGVSNQQRAIDEISALVWQRLYPDRPVPTFAPFHTEPEWRAIRDRVSDLVHGLAQEPGPPTIPSPTAEWDEQQRWIVIAAREWISQQQMR
ncbi:hypothetical protein [Saccharothrix variisporea]|uniref:Uncharacterized protein n=1 Tax=Saccharothrix variisporea TaxID=543527 RepID=A0A495X143_9PSEU|nr:hypothetical protein [Saccharothrix variisporea]RKT67640.1 hypothetical protein DFJ66_0816 [Saccharothrix variisporea]